MEETHGFFSPEGETVQKMHEKWNYNTPHLVFNSYHFFLIQVQYTLLDEFNKIADRHFLWVKRQDLDESRLFVRLKARNLKEELDKLLEKV